MNCRSSLKLQGRFLAGPQAPRHALALALQLSITRSDDGGNT
jgi:hypothetical protein